MTRWQTYWIKHSNEKESNVLDPAEKMQKGNEDFCKIVIDPPKCPTVKSSKIDGLGPHATENWKQVRTR